MCAGEVLASELAPRTNCYPADRKLLLCFMRRQVRKLCFLFLEPSFDMREIHPLRPGEQEAEVLVLSYVFHMRSHQL